MKAPAIPANEADRLHALESLDIIYSPAEERFDRITRIARRVFDVPIALVSLVTKDKQWFKSCQGLTAAETTREISFCGHAILSDDVFVVPNASKDPDFSDNPLVTGPPNIRFYAGQPLSFGGFRLGTLCVIDQRPRQLKPKDYDSLRCLGSWVEIELLAWRNDKSSYLNQVLGLEERDTLIDPVTGDLNESGLAVLKEKLGQTDLERHKLDPADQASVPEQADVDESLEITVQVTNVPDDLEQDEIDLLRKSVAQSIRVAVNDHGIIGQYGENGFSVLLVKATREQAAELISTIGHSLHTFINDEFDLYFIKPEFSIKIDALVASTG